MASGDTKSSRSYYGGGSGSSDYYDDEGRGASKDVWEWFQASWERNDHSRDWLFSLDDHNCYNLLMCSRHRYGVEDISNLRQGERVDSRASRLVIKKHDNATWIEFNTHMWDGWERFKDEKARIDAERNEEWNKRWEAEREKRQAEAVKLERYDIEQVSSVVDATAGMFRSEMVNAFTYRDRIGYDGDWIEDVVDTYIDGSGFGYEQSQAVGIKLQVTVSLDLSNSMQHNDIAKPAAEAFRDIALTLRQLHREYPRDLFVEAFTFAGGSWDANESGRTVRRVGLLDGPDDDFFGNMGKYKPSNLGYHAISSMFDGEDTWIKYLFERIRRWEDKHSDPGAVRIDLLLTDAVLEHPFDIRDADEIQERRDGNLQSVFLNFMPEDDWLGSTLPKRCFQLKVDADNITGILRNVLSEFLAVQV